MKLTEWFPQNVQPTIPGVYEVEPDVDSPWYSYWDGHFWGNMTRTPERAAETYFMARFKNMETWRGLAEKP